MPFKTYGEATLEFRRVELAALQSHIKPIGTVLQYCSYKPLDVPVMDPCLEDLGSRYVGTWYARMQTYPSYGCVRACIEA